MSVARLIAVITVALYLLSTNQVSAQAVEAGKTVATVGKVTVLRPSSPAEQSQAEQSHAEQSLAVPDPVYVRDVITTQAESSAKLMLHDDSILKMDADTQIELTQILVSPEQQQSTLKQLSGYLRILLGKKLKADSYYKVHTPVAVAGVRGTDFEVIITEDGKTIVRCYEGEVAVRNILEHIVGEVVLDANFYTWVEKDKPPVEPIPIPAGQSLWSALKHKQMKKDVAVVEFQKEQALEGEHEVMPDDAVNPGKPDSPVESSSDSTATVSSRNVENLVVTENTGDGINQLQTTETGKVSARDFSEQSVAGTIVMQNLGITPAGGVQNTGTQITGKVIEQVMQDVIPNGAMGSIDEPIVDSSAVAIDVIFPTP